jgi:hypothetical protein
MTEKFAKTALIALVLVVTAMCAQAQTPTQRYRREQRKAPEPAVPAVSVDKRDSIVNAAGPFNGHPYWLALAQCGGIYFKLNVLYTDAAVQARVVKPDPKAAADDTKKLNESIRTATTYFDAAEHFLMNDRAIERADAVLTYDGQSRASGDRLKTVDAAIAAAKPCPLLYRACQEAHPKQCNESLAPVR